MISIQGKVDIDSDRTRVFEAFSRISEWPLWWQDCRAVEMFSGWEVAAPLTLVLVPHKMSLRLKARVSGYKPPEMAAFDWSRLGVLGRFTWLFEDRGGGCLVEERVEMKGAGLLILRGLGQVEAMGHMVQRNLDGLKIYLEKGVG